MTGITENVAQATARRLGLAGLLPFVIGTGLLVMGPIGVRETTLRAIVIYGAVILSFMGAVHWGRAMFSTQSDDPGANAENQRAYVASVIPSLVGWVACFLTPRISLSVLAAAFTLLYLYDCRVFERTGIHAWYLPMRRNLTLVVVGCLILAAVLL